MKKLVLIAIGLSLIISGSAFAFSDVPEDHPNYEAIQLLEYHNVIQGYPDGTFRPDQPVNRVEILKILLLGSDVDILDSFDDFSYSDTDSSQWYAEYLATADDMGIVGGYPDGSYQPLKTVNLVEALKMIYQTHYKVNDLLPTLQAYLDGPYNDTKGENWFNSYLWAARNNNLVTPDRDGNIHPNKELTRGDLAELMYRMDWINSYNDRRISLDQPLIKSYRKDLTLDNLDVDNQSDAFDFEADWEDIAFPSSDIWLGSLSINGYWTRSVDWWVIDMTELSEYEGMETEEIFDAIRECPEEGYAQVDDPDGDGFGEPRRAYAGGVFCLRTNEYNYAKVQVIDAYSEDFGDDKFMKLRYIYRPDGSRELP
ncbi:S-layer homology domain-containing protein [Patescibacteria group bacterium]